MLCDKNFFWKSLRLHYSILEYSILECRILSMGKSLYSKDQVYLTEQLKVARKHAGLDQKEAAKLLNKTQSYISKIESGQRRIDVIELREIARAYKKELSFFLKEK